MLSDATLERASRLLAAMRAKGYRLATAESCTGGLIAAALTHVLGSSDVVDRGYVTYSNLAKSEMLGVDAALIASHGAVSQEVAAAMAEGALERGNVDFAIAVTGIAGPGGGSPDKPVGLVWFGCASRFAGARTERRIFPGSRADIRSATVEHAFTILSQAAGYE